MKKITAIILALALVISACAAFTFIGSADGSEATIPYLATAPKIDGKFSDGEWSADGKFTLSSSNALFKSGTAEASGDIYWAWNNDGLYIAAVIKDATIHATKYTAGTALNCTDGIQIELDPMNTKEAGYAKSYIFDFVPQSQGGGAIWYEHFRWVSGTQADIVNVAAEIAGDGYVIEAQIKWDGLRKLGETFEVKEGTKMGFGNIIMDIDGTHNALIADYVEICNAAKFNTMVLGAAGTVDPAPSQAAPASSCGNKA